MKKIVLVTIISVVCLTGLIVWISAGSNLISSASPALTELSSSDIDLILDSQAKLDQSSVQQLAESKEARAAFVAGLKEHLALASAAKAEGLEADPAYQRNLDYKSRILLADMYEGYRGHTAKDPFPVKPEEIDAVWQSSHNEASFEADMQALQAIQNDVQSKMGTGIRPGILAGEGLERAKKKWARTKIISDLAKADTDFIGSRDVGLRLQIVEAGILSSDLLRKHWNKSIKATDGEIAEFIALSPQFDINAKRAKAQTVLNAALAGEDLAKLAKQYSEHRPTKDSGGRSTDLEQGSMPPELEAVLLSSEPGKLIDRLIETELGSHIIRLDNKESKKSVDGKEAVKYSFTQILFQNKFEQPGGARPGVIAPFMQAQDIAKLFIENEKRQRFIADYVSKYEITMPVEIQENR